MAEQRLRLIERGNLIPIDSLHRRNQIVLKTINNRDNDNSNTNINEMLHEVGKKGKNARS